MTICVSGQVWSGPSEYNADRRDAVCTASVRQTVLPLLDYVGLGAGIEALTFYDFFAVSGLVTHALSGNWSCLGANDIDPRKAEVYEANFGLGHFHLGDIADVSSGDLPRGADAAWASFPCQDFSLAGWRHGMTARRSGTFWEFWRVMNELWRRGDRPPLIVLENVRGLLYDYSFPGLCEALAAPGLQFGALVIDAVRFVPQSRPRVFIVAADCRLDCSAFAESWLSGSPWFPSNLVRAWSRLSAPVSDLWRWWRLPVPAHGPERDAIELIEDGQGITWSSEEETERLLSLMSDVNRRKVEEAASCEGPAVGFLYKRTRQGRQQVEVRFDGVAGCIRTPRGGSSRQTVVLVKDGKVRTRLLTPREAARLMGAPDSFRLPQHFNDGHRAMGDAVVVPAVSWLSEHLLVPLALECRNAGLKQRRVADLPEGLVSSLRTADELVERWRQSSAVQEGPTGTSEGGPCEMV